MIKNNNDIKQSLILTGSQLKVELERCEYCEEKPCKEACPADCSPFDFIMAAKQGEPQDLQRSAAIIMKNNPLGGICGMVCPDRHCMAECTHKLFDGPINIPDVQAEIVYRAKQFGGIPDFIKTKSNGKKIAVVGAGPAGLGATSVLAQKGYKVDVFEARRDIGGMCCLIPEYRLDRTVLETDIEFLKSLGDITIKTNNPVDEPEILINEGYDAVVVSIGLWDPIMPGIPNQDLALTAVDYLANPKSYEFSGKVAVIGGGATALDCAVTVKKSGVKYVEMFTLETISEMPLTEKERKELLEYDVEVTGRTRVESINKDGIETVKVLLKEGKEFNLSDLKEIEGTKQIRNDISHVIVAIGSRVKIPQANMEGLFYAGDCVCGPTTVVEAVASGKNTALEVDSYIMKKEKPEIKKKTKSITDLKGYVSIPVLLETDFFGREISSPFLLSAAPPTDGYDQMKKAYEAGWTGGIMKTAFDNVSIHIPGEYMHVFNNTTYGNCDNVSGHSLSRVCGEVERLIEEYPDRLTMASTGGPISGKDEEDMKVWQLNTRKLESAGAMGIEYSLSCPQGGEGTEGDIVSQSAELTAKVIDWIMEISNPDIPKLFKLSAAVTSIAVIMKAVKEVLDRYPGKKAGVTLANTFPVVDFQERSKKEWEDGVLFGMSGEGVAPVSYFTLARAVPLGISISGNAGPMNYKQAAHFLALGAETVQFCTIVMKYGYGIFDELCNGVSSLMKKRSINSIKELIGVAQPHPITDFMDLSSAKNISSLINDLCVSCGNCARCPYLAIEFDEEGYPVIDPARCIGCSICAKKCFVGALYMRERTAEESEQLKED